MHHRGYNPPELPSWPASFSQIVVTQTPRRMVFVSGQVSVDAGNNIIGEGNLAIQAETAFRNLERALVAVGVKAQDVAKVGIYVKDFHEEDAAVIREAMRRVFAEKPLPTSTWLGVERLALDGCLIEVDAIAVI